MRTESKRPDSVSVMTNIETNNIFDFFFEIDDMPFFMILNAETIINIANANPNMPYSTNIKANAASPIIRLEGMTG